ncbi:MAG: T9SS type A sorting domain-containing protein [Ignavibacteriaceae bacterium]|nr:T9SS type A sorting domain-containing protein [Ignavibacteriaceae bacterium]
MKNLTAVFVIILSSFLWGQFNTPAIDANLATNEYGSGNINTASSGGTNWYVTWDDTYLYFLILNASETDAAVIYIDFDPLTPVNGGSDLNGNLTGADNYSMTPNLPFRSDALILVRNDYRGIWARDNAGGWAEVYPAGTSGLNGSGDDFTEGFFYVNDMGNGSGNDDRREFKVRWNDITNNTGRPASFNWLGVMNSASNIYGQVPITLPSGAQPDPATPDFDRYFTVPSTADGASSNPFMQESYTHIGGDLIDFGAISVYDFTMNTPLATITRANSGDWVITNNLNIFSGTINSGLSTGTIAVNNELNIGADGTFNFASTPAPVSVFGNFINDGSLILSDNVEGILRLNADYTDNGTVTTNGAGITFTKNGVQVFSTSSVIKELSYITVGVPDSTTTLQLSGPSFGKLIISSPFSGFPLLFGNDNCILDLNNRSLDIGTADMEASFDTTGKIKGGPDTQITLLGTAALGGTEYLGKLSFDPSGNTISSLTVNRTGTGAYFDLGSPLTLNSSLALTSGRISIGDNDLTIASTAEIVSYSASGFIKTPGTGRLIQSFTTLGPKTYPVGDSGYYRPASFNYSENVGTSTVGVRYVHPNNISSILSPVLSDGDYTVDFRSNYYWDFEGVNTSGFYNFGVTVTDAVGIDNEHVIRLIYSSDGSAFSTPGTHINGNNGNFARAELSGVTHGSGRFYFAGGSQNNNTLPVELTSFTAKMTGTNVKLNWATASEIDNFGFEIERTLVTEGQDNTFSKIGFVEGNGTVYTPKEYTWIDNTVNRPGRYQYRLKQIDTDGDFEYSDAVEVVFEAPKSFELSQNYPNPFNPSTRISFTVPADSRVKISVFNGVGELIKVLEDGIREAGYHSVVFDAASLPSGMYYYRLEAGDFVQSRKMLLIK